MVSLDPRPVVSVPEVVSRHAEHVEQYMRQTPLPQATLSGRMAAYQMGWADRDGRPLEGPPGKLVRPSLCLWACESAGADPELALPFAAAVEWIHNFTLIHDDIQDGDRERRHRETVWSVWGPGQGINAGDALHAFAFEQALMPGGHAARRLRAAHALARAVRYLVEGQCRDLSLEGRLGVSPLSYLRMATAKTGVLLGASMEVGAIVGGARPAVAQRLRRAGELAGVAFQIRDDWLGIWGDPELTGKSKDGDLARRKLTYPVVAGYAVMTGPGRRRFRSLFHANPSGPCGPPPPRDGRNGSAPVDVVPTMRALLEQQSADRLAAAEARRFAERAVASAAECHLGAQHLDQFEEFARYVANRTR